MGLGADFLLPKVSAVQAEQSVRSAPRDAGQSSFSGFYAMAREGVESPSGEAPAGANDLQSLLAGDEQTLADLGNDLPGSDLPGSDLPPKDEALLLPVEDVSLESLMLFGREPSPTAATSSEAVVLSEQAAPVDDLDLPVDAALAARAQDAEQPLTTPAAVGQMTAASAAQTAGIAQQTAVGVRPAAASLNEARSAVRQPTQPEASLASAEVEHVDGGERDFTELLRTSPGAVTGSAAQAAADGPDSAVNPLTQAVQQASAAQREAAANALQQPLAMRQPGMSEAVVERVMWLSSQNLKSAEIQLDPAELGRLEIRISLNQEQTQISFASPHASVREALEGQMHRLREMLSQQGMDQFDVNVSDQSLARGERQANERDADGLAAGGADADDSQEAETLIASTPLDSGRGLVDFYA